MKYGIGEKIFCKIHESTIVCSTSEAYEAQLIFEIIGIGENTSKYLILIPTYYNIRGCWRIKEEHLEKFNINPNWLDHRALVVSEERVCHAANKGDGMSCARCKEFCPMAESNQTNGSFICFSCRNNPYR